MILRALCLSFIILVSANLSAQTVTLNRLQRAPGLGYFGYTDGTGKQGYTLLSTLLTDYLTGTGTAGRIAAWGTADTLRSYIWEITDNVIQGVATDDPCLDAVNNFFTFNGNPLMGIKRTSSTQLSIFSGHANQSMYITPTAVGFNLSAVSPYWAATTTYFGAVASNGPRLSTATGADFTWQGDEDSGLNRISADVIGLHAGDGTNPMVKIDGVSDAITFDPDDDGTADVTISATTLSTELLDVGSYGTTPTRVAGLNAAGVVTEATLSGLSFVGEVLTATDGSITNEIQNVDTLALSGTTLGVSLSSDGVAQKTIDLASIGAKNYAEMHFNGEKILTATTATLLDWASSTTIESSGLDADPTNDLINPTVALTALLTFSGTVLADGVSFSGTIYFEVYKNGVYANKFLATGNFATNESKSISYSTLLSLSTNDEVQIYYYLSTAGTIDLQSPALTLTQVN